MPAIKWLCQQVSNETYESVGVFDVDGDGVPDLVSGEFWYKGPDYRQRFPIGPVQRIGEYFDDFSTIPLDVNGDGAMDFITGGWWGGNLRWRQNPGRGADYAKSQWPTHVIAQTGNIETTRAWDIDGDGQVEIVPNTPNGPLIAYKLRRDAQGKGLGQFDPVLISSQKQGHGLGFGPVTGAGTGDFVLRNGLLSPPEKPGGEYVFSPEFDLGYASIPVLVADVNGDGLMDLICGQAHAYGLDWWEQKRDTQGKRSWIKHPIDPCNSQYHDLQWADIDGDGQPELITGKRFRAHNGRDPGEFDDLGIYYFKWNGQSFSKQVISYGPPGVGHGCGIYFALADLRGTGRLDLIAPGKDGLQIFFNQGT